MQKDTWNRLGAAVVGLILLVGVGCSKSVQSDLDAKGMEQPKVAAKSGQADRSGQEAAGRAGTDAGSEVSKGSGREAASSGGAGSTGDGNLRPGEERVAEPIVTAKADTAEAVETVRRREEQAMQEELATAKAGLKDVYFAYDSFKITDEAQQALLFDAEWLRNNPVQTLAIEGHCDERGTQAYNMILGQKRAKAVRNFLIELGIKGERLTAVSYGKDRPSCQEHDESCYKQNRRGHLVVTIDAK